MNTYGNKIMYFSDFYHNDKDSKQEQDYQIDGKQNCKEK